MYTLHRQSAAIAMCFVNPGMNRFRRSACNDFRVHLKHCGPGNKTHSLRFVQEILILEQNCINMIHVQKRKTNMQV